MLELVKAFFENQVVAFIIVVGAVVFVHEFGHFFAARVFGIFVEEFSLGFGPKAFGFVRNGTEYKICWLPLGGYVRLYGQEIGMQVPLARRGEALCTAALYKRFVVSAAGPAMNLVLTFVVMAVLAWVGIARLPAQISVMPGSVAERSGIPDGALVLSIDGASVRTWEDFSETIASSAGRALEIEYDLDGIRSVAKVTPSAAEDESVYGEKVTNGRIGVTPYFQTPAVVVRNGGVFELAGFRTGDVILAIGGKKVNHFHEISRRVTAWRASDVRAIPLEISLLRNKAPLTLTIDSAQFDFFYNAQKSAVGGALGIISTDMQLAESKKQDLKSASAFEQWKVCGLTAGVTLSSIEGYGQLVSRVQLLDWVEKTERKISLQSAAGGDVEFLPVGFTVIDALGQEQQVLCNVKPRVGRDHLNRRKMFLDFFPGFASSSHTAESILIRSNSIPSSLADGLRLATNMGLGIFDSISKLVTGKIPFSNLGGPIEIARAAGTAAKVGWTAFATMIAFISINVGLLNLIPIPVLDGGTLLLLTIEAAYGRPLPTKVHEFVQRIGVLLMLILILLVLYNDILRRMAN